MRVTAGPLVWVPVCRADLLTPDRGIAVLVEGHPLAVFLLAATPTSDEVLHAVDHTDPVTGSLVIARGLVGSSSDRPYVASPLHKQRYDLATGECLDDPTLRLRTWPVRIEEGMVEVGWTLSDGEGDASLRP